jgi:hypothetical protein
MSFCRGNVSIQVLVELGVVEIIYQRSRFFRCKIDLVGRPTIEQIFNFQDKDIVMQGYIGQLVDEIKCSLSR